MFKPSNVEDILMDIRDKWWLVDDWWTIILTNILGVTTIYESMNWEILLSSQYEGKTDGFWTMLICFWNVMSNPVWESIIPSIPEKHERNPCGGIPLVSRFCKTFVFWVKLLLGMKPLVSIYEHEAAWRASTWKCSFSFKWIYIHIYIYIYIHVYTWYMYIYI